MQKLVILIACCFALTRVMAQPAWKVYHNNDVLLTAKEEDPKGNVVTLQKNDLDKPGEISLIYEDEHLSNDNNYKLVLGDSSFTPSPKNNKLRITVSNKSLKEILNHNDRATIYFTSVPKDPAIAASVRVRRIHLCTLRIE